ncbi:MULTISPECIES: hypothetical protein [unclassified Brevundimonas]|uniref:hypothetical protein n=1 Tax=unclassified Brevundimonas TaxID=2622653 RepID=UPI0025B83D70|nr:MULTISPECIES: hypothetical protein [unclassified Brevundimonas]
MRGKFLAVAALAIASAGLSGCLIIADGNSTKNSNVVTVTRGTPMGPYLRAFSADGSNVHATIVTNCTRRADFEVVLRDGETLTIRQHKDAVCEGTQRDLAVSWTYEVLALPAQSAMRVTNAVAF